MTKSPDPKLPRLPLGLGSWLPVPAVVGIVNLTPDSFSDGNALCGPDEVLRRAQKLVADGAHLVELGAESTRPGFVAVTPEQEWLRLAPALQRLHEAQLGVPLAVDTRNAVTAHRALAAGARVINDVSALGDGAMAACVARHDAVLVLMHGFVAPGVPPLPAARQDLQAVLALLANARHKAVAEGVAADKIWLDPGLGFGKDAQQNLRLVGQLQALVDLGSPVYFGPSRKRFLGEVTGHKDARARDAATAACCALAVSQGAMLLRVHEPAAVRDAVAVASAVRSACLSSVQ